MLKFFRLPFATSGDKTAVPDPVDVNGNVTYTQGYSYDYQRQKTDPAAKNIERDKMNQIFFDITNAIAEIQSQGIPDFITTALNGGTAYSYAQYAVVKYSGDLYISLVATNTALPSDATKWALLPTPARVRDGTNTVATVGGTADAITLALTPSQTAFAPGPTWWRAGAANATTTPTVKRDGLAAKTLVKGNNLPLAAGDIPGAGAWMCSQYDAVLDKEVLMTPATGASTLTATNDATGADSSGKAASSGWLKNGLALAPSSNGSFTFPAWLGGWKINWGGGTTSASAGIAVTWNSAFSSQIYVVLATAAVASPGAFITYDAPSLSGCNFNGWQNSTTRAAVLFSYFTIGK